MYINHSLVASALLAAATMSTVSATEVENGASHSGNQRSTQCVTVLTKGSASRHFNPDVCSQACSA